MRRIHRAAWLLGVLTLVSGATAVLAAEDDAPELATDRPDQTESTSIVQPGSVQLEIGVTRSEFEDDLVDLRATSYPEVLARIGVTRAIELRVGFDGYQSFNQRVKVPTLEKQFAPVPEPEEGAADASLGAKFYMASEKGVRPEMAVMTTLSIPSGEDELSTNHVDPSFRFLFSHTLTDRLSLGYNLGAAWATEDDLDDRDTISNAEWTLALGIGATERLGFFVEAFGETGLSAEGGPANSIDGGLTWLIRPNLQLDAAVGVGVTDRADDRFFGVGISWRYPR